jgi:hypothetical protein
LGNWPKAFCNDSVDTCDEFLKIEEWNVRNQRKFQNVQVVSECSSFQSRNEGGEIRQSKDNKVTVSLLKIKNFVIGARPIGQMAKFILGATFSLSTLLNCVVIIQK